MIEISLNTALAIYGAVIVIGAIALWLYTEITVTRTHRVLEKQHLWRCVYCAYTYLDEGGDAFSTCPRCGSLNALSDPGARFIRVSKEKKEAAAITQAEEQAGKRNPSRRKRPGARRRGPRKRG